MLLLIVYYKLLFIICSLCIKHKLPPEKIKKNILLESFFLKIFYIIH